MKFYALALLLLVVTTTVSLANQPLPETNNKAHYSELTAKKQINLLYRQLKDGYPFDQLARQYSQDYGSYTVGGNLGWQKPDQFVSMFTKAVSRLTKTQFSMPFKTEFGYHIVQLLDTKPGEVLTRHIVLRITS